MKTPRDLIREWREIADHAPDDDSPEGHYGRAMRDCAADLEAVLDARSKTETVVSRQLGPWVAWGKNCTRQLAQRPQEIALAVSRLCSSPPTYRCYFYPGVWDGWDEDGEIEPLFTDLDEAKDHLDALWAAYLETR